MKLQVQDSLEREAAGLKDLVEATLVEREPDVRSWAEEVADQMQRVAGSYRI